MTMPTLRWAVHRSKFSGSGAGGCGFCNCFASGTFLAMISLIRCLAPAGVAPRVSALHRSPFVRRLSAAENEERGPRERASLFGRTKSPRGSGLHQLTLNANCPKLADPNPSTYRIA